MPAKKPAKKAVKSSAASTKPTKSAANVTLQSKVKTSKVRQWECRCGHKWEAPVEMGADNQNISGEKTVFCPKCGKRAAFGSAVKTVGGQHSPPSIEDNPSKAYGKPAICEGGNTGCNGQGESGEVCRYCGGIVPQASKPSLAEKIAAKHTGPKSDLKPTAEQQVVIDQVARGFKVLVLIAGAGAGKTSTLRMVADAMEGNGQYTAFNNSLVADSAAKFQGTSVACNTTHSLAFRAIGSKYAHRLGGQRIKSDRVAQILELKQFSCTLPPIEGSEDSKPTIKRLPSGLLASFVMGAIKKFCQSADKAITTDHFRYVDGIDYPPGSMANNAKLREYLLPYANKAWKDIVDTKGQLPFAHDHYVKIWQLSDPVISADFILLDEAQDTAPVMLDILQQQTCPIILVGDTAQQIYEWRGAVDAMAAFPDADRCYLTQSFRFGQKIADVANVILSTFENKTDLRLRGLETIDSKVEKIEAPTAILCRTNAVAISNMLTAIAAGKKPFLVGGTADVIAFVKACHELQQGQSTSHPELACFDSWKEVQEYSKTDDGGDLQLMVKLITAFSCQVILKALNDMPEEKDADLVISTAHKSKGRQWAKVKVASDFPTKSKSTDSDKKLLYVTCTRAQEVLDITSCPFFTGNDAVNMMGTDGKEAAPVALVAPTIFTWSKGPNETWLVKGPKGMAGKTVSIVSKSGKTSYRRLGQETWSNEVAATYRV